MEFRFLPQDFLHGLVRTSGGERRCAMAMMAGGLFVGGAMMANALVFDASPGVTAALLLVMFIVQIGSLLGFFAARRRERRRLLQSTMLLCSRCRHPVVPNGERDGVLCPECGRGDTAQMLRAKWEEAYHVKLPHQQRPAGRVVG